MGRHKKPVELKQLEGTYRADRDDKRVVVSDLVPTSNKITCPENIKDKYCREYFVTHTKFLCSLGLLQDSDIPQLESMYILLEQIRKLAVSMQSMEVLNANYEKVALLYARLTDRFDKLASSYYISPSARTKLTTEMVSIKKDQAITESITSKLLRAKKA